MKNVTIFTQPGWMFCQRTKEYLSQKQIPFRERDVTTDADAVTELQRLDYVTTPVTVIDGTVIVGFDIAKIDAALSAWDFAWNEDSCWKKGSALVVVPSRAIPLERKDGRPLSRSGPEGANVGMHEQAGYWLGRGLAKDQSFDELHSYFRGGEPGLIRPIGRVQIIG